MHCPKCDADIGDTWESADPSVGILSGGWYCAACDIAVAEHEFPREPLPDDVPIMSASEFLGDRRRGTPISELASQPGTTDEQQAKYENFKRIARSWGYD
mgnify:CR=1 FL=1